MKECDQDKVMAFDALFTTNHIQMLKILLASVDPPFQQTLAVYIKLLELQYTINFFRQNPNAALSLCHENNDAASVLDELLPLCTGAEKEKIQNLKNIFQNFQNMQEMMEMMQIVSDMQEDEGFDMAGVLQGMFGE